MQTKNLKMLAWLTVLLMGLSSCNKDKIKCSGESEKTYPISGFNKVVIEDNVNLMITKGSVFSIQAKGCTESINDLQVSINRTGVLTVQYNTGNVVHDKAIDVLISMPQLLELKASGAAKTTILGMDNQAPYMRIILSGAAECVVNKAAIEMSFNLSGASKLNIIGTIDKLLGQLDGASYLGAYGLTSKYTDISTAGASKASVTAQDKLYIDASGASEVRYKGNPPIIFTQVDGTAKIIKE